MKEFRSTNRIRFYGVSIFLILAVIPFFLNLAALPLQNWDEARNAVNALEMSESGDYLTRHFNGEADQWETKPPLLLWFQNLSMKIVGFNTLGVRLPSALAGFGLIVVVLWFFATQLRDIPGGIFSGFVLITSQGFMNIHVVRTGDHDALLCFWLVLSTMFFYLAIRPKYGKPKYLIYSSVFMLCAFLTKSIVGLLFLPGFFLFVVIEKRIIWILKSKYTWLSLFILTSGIALYYYLAEQLNPGYLELVWDNEYLPRYLDQSPNYSYNRPGHIYYYLGLFASNHFSFWIYWLPVSVLLIFWKFGKKYMHFGRLLVSCGLIFLAIISFGSVNYWYAAPLYPIMAMLIGAGLSIVYRGMRIAMVGKSEPLRLFTLLGLPILLFFLAYRTSILFALNPGSELPELNYGMFMDMVRQEMPEKTNYIIVNENYNASLLFYQKVYNKKDNYNLKLWCEIAEHKVSNMVPCSDLDSIPPTSIVMACQPEILKKIEESRQTEILKSYKTCKLLEIIQ